MKLFYFTSDLKSDLGRPVPAKKLVPKWYKDAETYYVEEKGNGEEEKIAGLKTCIPFLDALTSGYTIVTPFDIFISKNDDGSLGISWNSPGEHSGYVVERGKQSGATIPRPAGHLPNHLIWANKWGFKVPRGYSVLVTHPLNRHDLPFTTLSGIIDSDNFIASGNIPFFLKEDFTGIIPEGTPVAQLIPIKRSNWTMVVNDANKSENQRHGMLARVKETSYKSKFWVRKDYR